MMEALTSHAPAALPAAAGQERYRLLRRLGEGGFGQVWEGWDVQLCRRVAVKRLKAQPAGVRPDCLLQEARIAASLTHPAFVRIFSVDGDGARQSIIMELVQGVTLGQLARGHALPADCALDIVLQVAEAMEEAHAAGLVHGDIKPGNLMRAAGGQVRILDFGLARYIDPLDTGPLVFDDDSSGTIAYLAPERLRGEPPGRQSDVYSLGAVLYELIVGARPFAHLSGLALGAAHVQSSSAVWPFPAGIRPRVAALVRAMTARDMRRRLRSMRAVGDSVRALKARR